MSKKYFLEGHRSKNQLDDDKTLLFDGEGFATIDDATDRAKKLFDERKELGLAVIYQEEPDGTRHGLKFIYRDDEGKLEESSLYWGAGDVCAG
jgi:hypothetical protein